MKKLSLSLLSTLFMVGGLYAVTLSSTSAENSLIIYNSNIALVHENRKLHLSKNDTKIIYEDVASSINTDSVNVTLPKGIELFSQQYRYDKLTQSKLLDAYIGKNISVKVMKNAKDFKTIKAQLLSNDGDSCIVKHNAKIRIVESKNIIFDTIPSQLITKPSLVWNVQSKKNINAKMSIDYLINQITWRSNYILNISQNQANLSGWISIDNRSGKAFKNTNLHVLAGEINRAYSSRRNYKKTEYMAMAQTVQDVSHQAHEGYHFYTIPFKVNLANNENTQLKFITQNNIAIKRKYIAMMSNPNYLHGERQKDVTQIIKMDGLEYPLPRGVVRSYSKLKNTSILLGESSIVHTPKDTPISLIIGKNFDVKVKETLLKRDKETLYVNENVKYSIKNSSNENKKVLIQIPFNKDSDSTIKSKIKYTYTKGNLVAFNIHVEANSTKEFTVYYRVKKISQR